MKNLRPPPRDCLLCLDVFLLRRRGVRASADEEFAHGRSSRELELRLEIAAMAQAYGLHILNHDSRHKSRGRWTVTHGKGALTGMVNTFFSHSFRLATLQQTHDTPMTLLV
eukprot:COSAG04_NODE_2352_length_4286_cov_6.280153_5_plen_111_part_00